MHRLLFVVLVLLVFVAACGRCRRAEAWAAPVYGRDAGFELGGALIYQPNPDH